MERDALFLLEVTVIISQLFEKQKFPGLRDLIERQTRISQVQRCLVEHYDLFLTADGVIGSGLNRTLRLQQQLFCTCRLSNRKVTA